MPETLRAHIAELISLYETQKQRADSLAVRLSQAEAGLESCKEQIKVLNQQIDNLKLRSAMTGGGDNAVAKERLDKLIREIDKCIGLLEK